MMTKSLMLKSSMAIVEPLIMDADHSDNNEVTEGEVVEPSEVPEAEPTVEQLLDALMAERDSFRDIAQRIQADFENYRKRIASQTADDIDRATGRIAESLLSVLDACEAAFISHPAEIEPLFNLLLGELKKQGLEALDLDGQIFDPMKADAVMHEEGEGDADGNSIVVDVMRTGYTWKGRVLRPAMVKVRG
jgi:molecular chaperone GrpE